MSYPSSGDDIVAYQNTNTNEIHLSNGPNPGLDARPNFKRVSLSEVPPSALDAARRAKTEQDSTTQAARNRAAGGFTDEAPGAVPMPTVAHTNPGGSNDSTGILSRPGMRDIQVGERPWEHPRGQEQLGALAEHERMYPDQRGVLERGDNATGSPTTVREHLLPPPVSAAGTAPVTLAAPAAAAALEDQAAGGDATKHDPAHTGDGSAAPSSPSTPAPDGAEETGTEQAPDKAATAPDEAGTPPVKKATARKATGS